MRVTAPSDTWDISPFEGTSNPPRSPSHPGQHAMSSVNLASSTMNDPANTHPHSSSSTKYPGGRNGTGRTRSTGYRSTTSAHISNSDTPSAPDHDRDMPTSPTPTQPPQTPYSILPTIGEATTPVSPPTGSPSVPVINSTTYPHVPTTPEHHVEAPGRPARPPDAKLTVDTSVPPAAAAATGSTRTGPRRVRVPQAPPSRPVPRQHEDGGVRLAGGPLFPPQEPEDVEEEPDDLPPRYQQFDQ
jgi:hypothetical protein